ncbi:MAG: hypothetical protein A2992_04920 [Elusimicrobia bacterium RIFCSPLOWO2_01_FULL_59_12]|nr:MAG: hypothetical protein A2992_04920 [Elusimicrobia bacterium RIFCSPLOWO2_01_FULL_59_12]
MAAHIHSVGIDLGGTWIRLEAVDAQGRRVRSLKAPAPSWKDLPGFLKQTFRAWKACSPRRARPRHLVLGSRGVWTPQERNRLRRALRKLAQNVRVISDVEAAWHAAFKSGAGIVVISGTGSIAFGRDGRGRSQRAGGWGPLLGDEGSAFWIGKTWLHRTRGHDFVPRPSVRRTAALAPHILRLAHEGNRLAKEIVRDAQHHLADLACSLARRLRLKKLIPLSWAGSLLGNPGFRAGFLTALRRSGRRFQATAPGMTPAQAIAKLPSFPLPRG